MPSVPSAARPRLLYRFSRAPPSARSAHDGCQGRGSLDRRESEQAPGKRASPPGFFFLARPAGRTPRMVRPIGRENNPRQPGACSQMLAAPLATVVRPKRAKRARRGARTMRAWQTGARACRAARRIPPRMIRVPINPQRGCGPAFFGPGCELAGPGRKKCVAERGELGPPFSSRVLGSPMCGAWPITFPDKTARSTRG